MSDRARPVVLCLLLAFGAQIWLVVGQGAWGSDTLLFLAIALALCPVVAPLRPALLRLGDALHPPTPRARGLAAVAIALASGAYLLFTATRQGRTFAPASHDEFMYLLQARLLTAGRLWMPAHRLADFFDTFYVFVTPVYAPLGWPGTALLFAPAMWMGLPHWLAPLAASAVSVGLMYSVVTQLVNGLAGAIGSLALLALAMLGLESIASLAQVPILLWGLSLAWAWLRWRASPGFGNALLIGVIAGWAAITRPADALCLTIPLAIAVLLRLPTCARLPRITSPAGMIAGAIPFLALQVVFNWGVTGSVMKTPHAHYRERDLPLVAFGFKEFDADRAPQTSVLQKQLIYRDWAVPAAAEHSLAKVPTRLAGELVPVTFRTALPHPLLLILLPVGLMQGFSRGRYVVWGVLPLFLLLYACYPFFVPHYALVVAPASILLVVLALPALESTWRGSSMGVALAIAALSIGSLPELDRHRDDGFVIMPAMDFSVRTLPRIIRRPALVLFRFSPGQNVHDEPVYNIDTPNPDDADIIRAHDLGPDKNREIIEYYGRRQPDRHVYVVDRADLSCRYVGRAGDLWRKLAAADAGAAPSAASTKPAGPDLSVP